VKLINKFTLWYLAISTLVLLLGGIIVFYKVQLEIEKEVTRRLQRDIDLTAKLLEDGAPIDSLDREQLSITEISFSEPLISLRTSDSLAPYSPRLTSIDRKFTVTSSYKINGKHYAITAHNFIAEPDEILEGIIFSLVVTFLILLVFVALASHLMSKQILSPFNHLVRSIQSFSLKQKVPIKFPHTDSYEFKEINLFLEKMTAKALEDYRALKEFSENASHELQTPLAIMRGKLELLMETNISEDQASFILSIQNAVQKLSAVNQSLSLLTRLENQEYLPQKFNFTQLVEKTIAAFAELVDMKSIRLTTEISPAVHINLNPVLADIMFTNLLSNAIRHNITDGFIRIVLSPAALVIENSGVPPKTRLDELFKRFKKDNQSSDSTGLGLAIVKQICDLNNFHVSYQYTNAVHILTVRFTTTE
jgi:signal transduction histidine kinase